MIEAVEGNIYRVKLRINEPNESWMLCTKTVKTKYFFDILKTNYGWKTVEKTWYSRKNFNEVHDVIEVFNPIDHPEAFL